MGLFGGDLGGFLGNAAPILGLAGGYALGGPVGAMIGSSIGSGISGAYANEQNKQLSKEQMAFQERMSNTAHQRQVHDLRMAGLNPLLSANMSGASTPQGAIATMNNVGEAVATGARDATMANMQAEQLQMQGVKQKEEIANMQADKKLKEAQTAKTYIDAEVSKKGIPESEIKNLIYNKAKSFLSTSGKSFQEAAKEDAKERAKFFKEMQQNNKKQLPNPMYKGGKL